MGVKFPLTHITNAQKYADCYEMLEALRIRYNEEGTKLRENLISKEMFDNWVKTWYDPRLHQLEIVLLAFRTVIKNNNPLKWDLEECIQLDGS